MKYRIQITLSALSIVFFLCSHQALATPVSEFSGNDWVMFANDDGHVGPGGGSQDFDAEYLFYKQSGTILSIGLQTGFNVETGVVNHCGFNYYAGDLALSFDNDSSNYEYAFDFGLQGQAYWETYRHETLGTADASGLYNVSAWNNDIFYEALSSPFAMETGTLLDVGTNTVASEGDSYYRILSFDLTSLGLSSYNGFDAHWTMSCGNDVVEGTAPVPEPATLLLFGTGLAGLATTIRRKKMKKA